MDKKKPRSKPTLAEVISIAAAAALLATMVFVEPAEIIENDWTPEFANWILSILPFYFAGCLVVAVGLVIASLRRFPKYVAATTVVATIIALSGTLVPLKIFRDDEARQARTIEADKLADSILSMASLTSENLPSAAREELRRILVTIHGEKVTNSEIMKPTDGTEVKQ